MDHDNEIIIGCHAASDGFSRGTLPDLNGFEFLGVRCREGRSSVAALSGNRWSCPRPRAQKLRSGEDCEEKETHRVKARRWHSDAGWAKCWPPELICSKITCEHICISSIYRFDIDKYISQLIILNIWISILCHSTLIEFGNHTFFFLKKIK